MSWRVLPCENASMTQRTAIFSRLFMPPFASRRGCAGVCRVDGRQCDGAEATVRGADGGVSAVCLLRLHHSRTHKTLPTRGEDGQVRALR